jgi:hypothetical protein
MIEILKHTFGFCGESHPSLLSIAGLTSLLYMCRVYIIMYWGIGVSFIKTFLTRLCKPFRHN